MALLDHRNRRRYSDYGSSSYAVTPTAPVQLNVQWVPTGKIRLKKIDAETQQGKPQGEGSFEGAVYEIFDRNGKKQDTLTTDKKGEAVSKLLPYGIYTIREVKAPLVIQLRLIKVCNCRKWRLSLYLRKSRRKGSFVFRKQTRRQIRRKSPHMHL